MAFNITEQSVKVRVEGNADNTLFRVTWPFRTRTDWTALDAFEPDTRQVVAMHLAQQPVPDPTKDGTIEFIGGVAYVFDRLDSFDKEYVWKRKGSMTSFTRGQMCFLRRDAAAL